ncbi:MAG: hypothetical protein JRN21_09340 [Nitrososphaerota archaeon]|nr:hypothetical protein [Nitrososphaerota archaeon]
MARNSVTQTRDEYKKQLGEEIRSGVSRLVVDVRVPPDGVHVNITSVDLTIRGLFPQEAKKVVRLLKDNGLD